MGEGAKRWLPVGVEVSMIAVGTSDPTALEYGE
jgi:hypothetical protein